MFTQQRNTDKIKEYTVNGLKSIGSEVLTVAASVVQLSTTLMALKPKAIHVYVDSSIATKAIRYTYDGSTPAAGTGIARFDNDEFVLEEYENLSKFKAIREAAGTHTLFITYLK